MENKDDGFHYTYSAKEQEEVKQIRKKYESKEMDKMEQLRRLDASVTSKAISWALVVGIIGLLIMGSGMSLAMTNFGEMIGLYGSLSLLTGIVIGVIGMIIAALAYPLYSKIIKKEREKIAPEIIRLTDELMKQ